MAVIAKRLYEDQPATTIATLYTVPVGTKTIVKNIIINNTTLNDAKINIHFVKGGDTAGAKNKINNFTVRAEDMISIDLSSVIEEGDTIQALQITSGALTLYISGVEVV